MFSRLALAFIVAAVAFQFTPLRADSKSPSTASERSPNSDDAKEALTDAAVIALIIAASIKIYKATGHPCACPSDLMRNGQPCGGRSAWSKPGGARPLCFPNDVTPAMISAYRATKAIPAVW
jgi:hypothetical protein